MSILNISIKSILILIIALTSCVRNKTDIRVTFSGDVILDRGVSDKVRFYGDSILVNSIRQYAGRDYFVINYEGTFTRSNRQQRDRYNFKADENMASLLNDGGITHASLAIIHIVCKPLNS
jgi:hypothetical protein